jgi:hypothetical protein
MTQREAFEAWATSQGINITDNGFGGYDSQWTEGALAGWEAAQAQEAVEPVAYLTETEQGPMVWTPDMYGEACTYCDDGEFPVPLYTSPPTQAAVEPVGYFYLDYGGYKQVGDLISFPGCVKLYTSPPDTDRLQQRVRELESDLEKHRELLLHHQTAKRAPKASA